MHVPRETFATWKANLERSVESARSNRPDLTRDEYLASTFYLQMERVTEIGREWQRSMLQNLDLCRAIARFKFTVSHSEIADVLARKKDLEVTDPESVIYLLGIGWHILA